MTATREEVEAMDGPMPKEVGPAWERFFAKHGQPKLNSEGFCEEVFADGWLFPLQRQRELAWMLAQAKAANVTSVLDIGSDKGGGLLHWCLLPDVRRIAACEIRGLPYAASFEGAFPKIDFLWCRQGSLNPVTLERVKTWLGANRFGAAFFDGDKSFFAEDFDAYRPYISDLAFFHDITDAAPGEAFSKVANRFHPKRITTYIDKSDSQWAEDREARGVPPLNAHEGWLRFWKGRSCGVGMVRLS